MELRGRTLGALSGGELQLAIVGRALAQSAPVLLLDEPTAALDMGHQQQVLALLDVLRRERGLTIVTAMHDLTLAAQFAERLVLLAGGTVVADGSAREVLTVSAIRRYYDATVDIVEGTDGHLVVVPRRAGSNEGIDGDRASTH
jgi:iron complex transport system ATP-binding protein